MTTYKLIANPQACRGEAVKVIHRAAGLFKKRGLEFDLEYTKRPGEGGELASRAVASGDFDVIVAVGGDGTINEIIQGMAFSSKPLGIIPAGSGNDFTKAVGIPRRLDQALDVLAAGRTRTIDLGCINKRYFANGVGIGFDAAVNRASLDIHFLQGGFLLYFWAFLSTITRYHAPHVTITVGDEVFDQRLFLVTVGNGTTFGGGFKLTPHAQLDDGQLDVTMLQPVALPTLFWHLPKVFLGTIERARCTLMRRTKRLVVKSPDALPMHVDGEFYGGGKAFQIEIVPRALTVIGNF